MLSVNVSVQNTFYCSNKFVKRVVKWPWEIACLESKHFKQTLNSKHNV